MLDVVAKFGNIEEHNEGTSIIIKDDGGNLLEVNKIKENEFIAFLDTDEEYFEKNINTENFDNAVHLGIIWAEEILGDL